MLCFFKGSVHPIFYIYIYLYSHPIYPPRTFYLSCCCFVPSCIDFRSFSKHASTYHSTYVPHLFLFCSLHWGVLFWKSTGFAMLFLCLTSWTGPWRTAVETLTRTAVCLGVILFIYIFLLLLLDYIRQESCSYSCCLPVHLYNMSLLRIHILFYF